MEFLLVYLGLGLLCSLFAGFVTLKNVDLQVRDLGWLIPMIFAYPVFIIAILFSFWHETKEARKKFLDKTLIKRI